MKLPRRKFLHLAAGAATLEAAVTAIKAMEAGERARFSQRKTPPRSS